MRLESFITLPDMPTPSVLLGSTGNSTVISMLQNSYANSSFFGSALDKFSDTSNYFINTFVAPAIALSRQMVDVVGSALTPDAYVTMTKIEDFEHVSPSMHMPILMYEPVRKLFEQGRVQGFGYSINDLPYEDVYGRVANNGYIENVATAMDDKGVVTFTWDMYADDPDLDPDDCDAILDTRRTIDKILAETLLDPTAIRFDRG